MVNKRRRKKRTRGPGLVATLRDPDKVRVAYIVAGLALVFGGSLGFGASKCGPDQPYKSGPVSAEDPIVIVMDREISYGEFWKNYERSRIGAAERQGMILPPEEFWAELKYKVLINMIDMEYMCIRAEETGITVSEEDIDERVESIRQMLLPPDMGDEDRSIFERIGDAFSKVKEEKAFDMALKSRDPTLTVSRLRDIFHQELLAEGYITQVQAELEGEMMSDLNKRATDIRTEITGERDFSDAASEYSDHAASSSAGGLIPLVKHDNPDLPQTVIASAFSLPVGEVSLPLPVATQKNRGVWLLEVIDRKEASGVEWDDARSDLQAELLEEKKRAVEAGEITMEGQEITVDPEEVTNAYEEATIKVIYLRGDDPVYLSKVAIREDQEEQNIVINDPEIRAMHHAIHQEWALAAADYSEAIQKVADRLAESPEQEYAYNMEEARLRYLIGILWATPVSVIARDIGNMQFDELPQDIKEEMHAYFVISLMNFNRAAELEDMNPWFRFHRAQMELAREQISEQMISDLEITHEYSSLDPYIEERVLQVLNHALELDDKALEAADGERPETWTEPVTPEDEMNLTLEDIDRPFIELIEIARQYTRSPDDVTEDQEMISTVEDEAIVVSMVEDEIEVIGEPIVEDPDTDTDVEVEVSEEDELPEEVVEQTPEHEIPDYLPNVPPPEPTGPLTQELRDRLDALHSEVQTLIDIMRAERMAEESPGGQEIPPEILEQLEMQMPEEMEPPSEDAENLLEEEAVESDE